MPVGICDSTGTESYRFVLNVIVTNTCRLLCFHYLILCLDLVPFSPMDTPDFSGLGLGFVHINSQSLFPKLGEFELMLSASEPDVVSVTETWFNDKIPDGLVSMPNYTVVRHDRQLHKRGGGTACYFKSSVFPNLDSMKRYALWKSNSEIEMQVFELKVCNIKKIILLNVYRPPSGSADAFIEEMTDTLQSIPCLNEYDIFILGDCNLPYNCRNSASYKKLKEFELKFGFIHLITKPTRHSGNAVNILDLIFTNSNHISRSSTWETTFSDHEPIYVIKKKSRCAPIKTSFQCRCFSDYCKESF